MPAPVQELGSKVENFNRGKFSHRLNGLDSFVFIMYFANANLKGLTSLLLRRGIYHCRFDMT